MSEENDQKKEPPTVQIIDLFEALKQSLAKKPAKADPPDETEELEPAQ